MELKTNIFAVKWLAKHPNKEMWFQWHAVASWTWDAQDETCGICRMAFDGCCPDCKLPGDDCPLRGPVPLKNYYN
ncbi:anaphase-promoting complex subunit 11 [Quercus suber]|uniref:Anaphase-promoting complex subunit 11 n=1 Tax=Quercus suber TaxID=58331 RepID=A0AAW0L7P2_QUESU